METKEQKKKKTILAVLLLLLLLALVSCVALRNRGGNEVSSGGSQSQDVSSTPVVPEEPKKMTEEDLINIILVGRNNYSKDELQPNSMLLCSLNPETNEVSMISFLSHTFVPFPEGQGEKRMEEAYVTGGFPLLYKVMEENFGLHVDGGVEFDFEGYVKVIDILGGVDVELDEFDAKWMKLPEGMNHIDGKTALKYSLSMRRDADFGRTQRQRAVLNDLYKKFKNSDLTTMTKLAKEIIPLTDTDMSEIDLLKLLTKLVPMLPEMQVSAHVVPAEDAYKAINDQEEIVQVPNLEMVKEDLFEEYLPLPHE